MDKIELILILSTIFFAVLWQVAELKLRMHRTAFYAGGRIGEIKLFDFKEGKEML